MRLYAAGGIMAQERRGEQPVQFLLQQSRRLIGIGQRDQFVKAEQLRSRCCLARSRRQAPLQDYCRDQEWPEHDLRSAHVSTFAKLLLLFLLLRYRSARAS